MPCNKIALVTGTQSCTTVDPTRGSGRVKKITGKGGSGRVGSSPVRPEAKIQLYFKVPWYRYFILNFSLYNVPDVRAYVQYLMCSFQCVLGDVTDSE